MRRFWAMLMASLGVICSTCSPDAPPATSPPAKAAGIDKDPKVDAEHLPEGVRKALTEQVIAKAVYAAVNKRVKEFRQRHGLVDDVDDVVLVGPDKFDRPHEDGDRFSVWLLRSGPAAKEPQTVIVSKEGQPLLRFTRVVIPGIKPVAILSRIRQSRGQYILAELYMEYEGEKGWQVRRAKEQHEKLGD
jgi:hypothetical protein